MKQLACIFLFFIATSGFAQDPLEDETRLENIRFELEKLAIDDPDILKEVDIQVDDDDIQSFIHTLVKTANINVNIDPTIEARVSNYFTDVKALDIIIYLCRNYNLDATIAGNIIFLTKVEVVQDEYRPDIVYDSYSSRITMNLERDTLYKVIRAIVSETGENIILSPNVNKDQLITLYMQDVEVDDGIRNLGYAINLSVSKDQQTYYYRTAQDERQLQSQLEQNNPQDKELNAGGNPRPPIPTDQFSYAVDPVSRRISVDALKVPLNELFNVLTTETDQNYILTTDFPNNEFATVKAKNLSYQEYLEYILRGKDYTYTVQDGVITVGKKAPDLFTQEIFQFNSRSFDEVMEAMPQITMDEIEMKEFKELNSLLISGPKSKVTNIVSLLEELDRVVPQVHMEVVVVEVSKDNLIDTGIRAGLAPSDSTLNTQGQFFPNTNGYFTLNSQSVNNLISRINNTGFLNLGQVSPNFYLQLKALEANGNSETRSTNRLSALNGHEASFTISEKINYFVEQNLAAPNNQNGISTLTTRTVESIDANTEIKITPFVAGDGQVTLDVGVQFANFTGAIPTSADELPPGVASQSFNSLIRVNDRDMIVLGGLERETDSENRQGVPFFSRIPVIKWFLNDKQKRKGESSTLIFIRPTIIY